MIHGKRAVRPLIVTVTGSECTGKTTLAVELAQRHESIWVPEYVRGYVDRLDQPLEASDVEPIAHGQIEAADEAARSANRLLILDTDLISTVLYSRHYYGTCPEWIERAARERLADLYLLLHPDVPWVPDGQQRDRGHKRDEMHAIFLDGLKSFGARHVDIRGVWDERRAEAFGAVDSLLARGG